MKKDMYAYIYKYDSYTVYQWVVPLVMKGVGCSIDPNRDAMLVELVPFTHSDYILNFLFTNT